jgi:hypothetical protein
LQNFRNPKSEEDKPKITLTCDRCDLYCNEAVESEIELLKKELSNYLVIATAE